jgi:hypothetical protein
MERTMLSLSTGLDLLGALGSPTGRDRPDCHGSLIDLASKKDKGVEEEPNIYGQIAKMWKKGDDRIDVNAVE